MSGERSRLCPHAFHEIAIANDRISMMIDQSVPGPVVARGQLRFGNGHADCIRTALSQGPRRDLDTRPWSPFGMPRRLAPPLSEPLNVTEGEREAGQIEETVKQ